MQSLLLKLIFVFSNLFLLFNVRAVAFNPIPSGSKLPRTVFSLPFCIETRERPAPANSMTFALLSITHKAISMPSGESPPLWRDLKMPLCICSSILSGLYSRRVLTISLSKLFPMSDINAPGTPCPVQSTAAIRFNLRPCETTEENQQKSPLTMSLGLYRIKDFLKCSESVLFRGKIAS